MWGITNWPLILEKEPRQHPDLVLKTDGVLLGGEHVIRRTKLAFSKGPSALSSSCRQLLASPHPQYWEGMRGAVAQAELRSASYDTSQQVERAVLCSWYCYWAPKCWVLAVFVAKQNEDAGQDAL